MSGELPLVAELHRLRREKRLELEEQGASEADIQRALGEVISNHASLSLHGTDADEPILDWPTTVDTFGVGPKNEKPS